MNRMKKLANEITDKLKTLLKIDREIAGYTKDLVTVQVNVTNGRVTSDTDFVFYNNLRHPSGAVTHIGDNLTGVGAGDDEQIKVSLDQVPSQIERISFTVTIHEAMQRRESPRMQSMPT